MYEENGELEAMEYDEERERNARIKDAELGRKYQAANEVLLEIIDEQRENIIRQLENTDFENDTTALSLVLYLRVLRISKNLILSRIDAGKLAEEELRDDGE